MTMHVARKSEWSGEMVKTTQLVSDKPNGQFIGWAHVFTGVIQEQLYVFVNKRNSEQW